MSCNKHFHDYLDENEKYVFLLFVHSFFDGLKLVLTATRSIKSYSTQMMRWFFLHHRQHFIIFLCFLYFTQNKRYSFIYFLRNTNANVKTWNFKMENNIQNFINHLELERNAENVECWKQMDISRHLKFHTFYFIFCFFVSTQNWKLSCLLSLVVFQCDGQTVNVTNFSPHYS